MWGQGRQQAHPGRKDPEGQRGQEEGMGPLEDGAGWAVGVGTAQPGSLHKAVRLLPVGQQLGRLLVPEAHIVVDEELGIEVVDLTGHVQDVADPAMADARPG